MKLQVLQQDLAKNLNLSSRFVSTKAQIPVLANILFSAEKTRLKLLSTNLEVSLTTAIGAKIEKEGEIAIPTRTIVDLISNLSPGTINLEAQKEKLSVVSESFSAKIAGMNSSDFPSIPQKLGTKSLKLPTEDFLKALAKVSFAASIDETRPILTGVLFIFDGLSLMLVASDGFRLSQKKVSLTKKTSSQKMVLPKSALFEMTRIAGGVGENINLEVKPKENQVVFGLGESILSTRILEGQFPDFEKIIPKSSETKLSIDKEEFLQAVKLASVFARESANIVKIKAEKGSLTVMAKSSKSGSQKTRVDAKVEGPAMEISYNFRFIEEFLNCLDSDEVQIEFKDTNSPGIFRDPKDQDFLHLIMPVRVQN